MTEILQKGYWLILEHHWPFLEDRDTVRQKGYWLILEP
jgi:hypothetical protein